MNAYELADLMFDVTDCETSEYYKAGMMLRQQADRIVELENQLDKCSHHEAMAHQGGYEIGRASQIKELSDEEIYEVLYSVDWAYDPVKFARAILKKASEK